MRETRATQLRDAARLGRGLTRGLWRIHAFVVLFALQVWGDRLPRQLAWIRIGLASGASRRFWLRDFTQARALVEVLAEEDYGMLIEGPVRTIVDLGANAGQASVYLHDRFPDASILAVEADPDTARLAALNTAADPHTEVLAAAVTDHDGMVTVTRLPGHSWGSNIFSKWSGPASQQLEVRSVTLATLLRDHDIDHVDVLKVDIEGAEMLALTSDETLARVGMVIGELHPSILNMTVDQALGALQDHGGFQRAWMHREFVFALARTPTRADSTSALGHLA
jgi:FkbM family methyltransferase